MLIALVGSGEQRRSDLIFVLCCVLPPEQCIFLGLYLTLGTPKSVISPESYPDIVSTNPETPGLKMSFKKANISLLTSLVDNLNHFIHLHTYYQSSKT